MNESLKEKMIWIAGTAGRKLSIFKAGWSDSFQAESLIPLSSKSVPHFSLVKSPLIFESLTLETASQNAWQIICRDLNAGRHLICNKS